MIISPPFVRPKHDEESDALWVERMMPIDINRGFPLNRYASWHGGVHIRHTDRIEEGYDRIEAVRAIADGVVVSFRKPSGIEKRDNLPLNLNGRTDDGYVLLRHETDIGENCNVVYYSLYMHLRDRLDPAIRDGAKVCRKERIGLNGMVDGTNTFHFQVIRRYNIWYYPWYGRGLLQLTNPENYFDYFNFRGRTSPENVKNALIREYGRLYSNRGIRYTDNHLSDIENHVPENIIQWRNSVSIDSYEAASSAGFYWVARGMAPYSDNEHILERCSVNVRGRGIKICYRSPAFWQASAAVNLPNQINNTQYQGLNGFEARCCVYGSAIAVLTEQKFPDSLNTLINLKPESEQLRRG